MPELPDITIYQEALRPRVIGATLENVRVRSPFLVRSFEPPLEVIIGRRGTSVERLGKRIVLGFDGDFFAVIHLMIAGRFLWKPLLVRAAGKIDLAAFDFARSHAEPGADATGGTLVLTEAGTKKRASLHIVEGREALAAFDPGGVDPLTASWEDFALALRRQNRTIKRALTTPQLFSGIGNSYSDEILHAARISPIRLTGSMTDDEIQTLHAATAAVLRLWTDRLRQEFRLVGKTAATGGRFPKTGEITAFRPDFAVHGKFGEPCPVCGCTVQRIVRAENEINYCPGCQTHGKLLADRSLSRLLKEDWPATAEEWEAERGKGETGGGGAS